MNFNRRVLWIDDPEEKESQWKMVASIMRATISFDNASIEIYFSRYTYALMFLSRTR